MKMKTLYDAASRVEASNAEFEDVLSALQLLEENMERDGMIPEEQLEPWMAANFMARFPMHLSTFRVLCRELGRISRDLEEATNQMYEESEAQKGAEG